MTEQMIGFNPNDTQSMNELMEKYGDSNTMKFGVNELGEDIAISIHKDKIVVATYQNNGWARRNTYYPNGEMEERYDGKWKSSLVSENQERTMK